ncbi:MAG: tRNA-guanine transglycosylase, partial [Oligoflexia bacterium]|nr:tRNA-guanine transglycosylase [Oligoflexia bacterium]
HNTMCEILDATMPHIPADRPRYLMGVGRPVDLVEGAARGVDMFDCVIATRHSRSGMFYTWQGRLRITDRRYRNDMYPPDTECGCPVCTRHTRAYLNHLFRVGEILGATLTTVHNLYWFAEFMARMRAAIQQGPRAFEEFRRQVHRTYPVRDTTPQAPSTSHSHSQKGGHRGRKEGRRPKGGRK